MPDYDPNQYPERWLLGACSSGDPLRWAVVAVAEKIKRLAAAERDAEQLAEQVRQLMRERDAIEYQRDELLDQVGALTRSR